MSNLAVVHANMPVGGRLRFFRRNWEKITSDPTILEAIEGYRLEFKQGGHPVQIKHPYPYKLNHEESLAVNEEIQKLIHKEVIALSEQEEDQIVSNIFTRKKKDGGHRMILDLSELNDFIVYRHFKMDTFETARALITKDCYMASLDLRDAYYSVPIASSDRKFFKFSWNNSMYNFQALPNGLSSGPRLFTKILKPPLAKLREMGHVITAFIDDSLIVARTAEQAANAVHDTAKMLENLGFIIHPDKSVFTPVQEIEYLGFKINSTNMTVYMPTPRKIDIKLVCTDLIHDRKPTIKKVSRVIGKLVAALPATKYGPLHYRSLEQDKIKALKANHGHYDRHMTISNGGKQDLQWWIEHVDTAYSSISIRKPDIHLTSDASGLGWGASDGVTHIGGRWNTAEAIRAAGNEINYLEMLAAFFALKAFCRDMHNKHVKLSVDNTTAVAYINHMGGSKSHACNELAKLIWDWCIHKNIWVSVVHLPGVQNTIADRQSRHFEEETEWMLNRDVFQHLQSRFNLTIDLFASRLNAQLPRYISWKPDPGAEAVDALSLDWGEFNFYAFPPFCIIGKCLQKIVQDKAEGLLIVPKWPTQAWFPQMLGLLTQDPIILPRTKSLLTKPVSGDVHPLNNKLILLACRLSGNQYSALEYQQTLPKLSYRHGETPQKHNTMCTSTSGFNFVLGERTIQCKPLQLR